MSKPFIVSLSFLLLSAVQTISGKAPSPAQPVNVTEDMQYYLDTSGNLDLSDVLKLSDNEFRPAARANLGFFVQPIWLRFRLPDYEERMLLRHDYALTDYLTLYAPAATGGYTSQSTGDMVPFVQRALNHRLMSFWIDSVKDRWYFIRLQTAGSVNFSFRLMTAQQALEQDHTSQYFLGIFFGTIIVMFFYNLFVFFSLRTPAYVFYCLYIAFFALMAATLNGSGYQLLWPNSPWMQNHAFPLFANAAMGSGLVFVALFLNLRALNRVLYLIACGLAVFPVLGILATLAIHPAVMVKVTNAFGILWILFILGSAIYAFVKGYKPARYFLLAWIMMLLGTAVFTLTSRGVLPPNPFLLNAMFFGSALEVILLSLALADRINQLKKEKEKLQLEALERQKLLTDSYSRFFPRRILDLLNRDSVEHIQLGDAAQFEMTVLFADIRGFTTLSERMSPEDNFRFLNSYLKRVGPIIRENNGFIDKYIGDGIMALFPEQAKSALDSAIKMQATVRKYNHHRMRSGYDPIRIGIGIHKGPLMVGTVGEAERMDGTVISDAVNLAARIESLTKKFEAGILISEMVFHELPDPTQYNARVIARVKVKGKEQPVTVLQVFDGMPDYAIEMLKATRREFEKGFFAFHEKHFAEAIERFRTVVERDPSDSVAQMYLDKARYFSRFMVGGQTV
ncbi:MAG: guanylate cyclase [Turneriella sp.]